MIVTVFLILASINFLQHLFIRFLFSSFSFNEKTTFPNTSKFIESTPLRVVFC